MAKINDKIVQRISMFIFLCRSNTLQNKINHIILKIKFNTPFLHDANITIMINKYS